MTYERSHIRVTLEYVPGEEDQDKTGWVQVWIEPVSMIAMYAVPELFGYKVDRMTREFMTALRQRHIL